MQGKKINNNIVIEPTNDNSGMLTWDTSDINSGIYIIQILMGGESLSFPIIINR
ncbi:MAG: hypothetical protein EPN82_17105 [Bacteroidetes bacterium]|nr:MAG: hypothetical protein EPN82_17105 [Bacteroidota bacterium]